MTIGGEPDLRRDVRTAVLDKWVRAQRDAEAAVEVSAVREALYASQDKDGRVWAPEANGKT